MVHNLKQLTPAIAIHPGEIMSDELKFRGTRLKKFAKLIGIPQRQLNEIIKGKRSINADIALTIGKALKMDAVLWLNLQCNYEIDAAKLSKSPDVNSMQCKNGNDNIYGQTRLK